MPTSGCAEERDALGGDGGDGRLGASDIKKGEQSRCGGGNRRVGRGWNPIPSRRICGPREIIEMGRSNSGGSTTR